MLLQQIGLLSTRVAFLTELTHPATPVNGLHVDTDRIFCAVLAVVVVVPSAGAALFNKKCVSLLLSMSISCSESRSCFQVTVIVVQDAVADGLSACRQCDREPTPR